MNRVITMDETIAEYRQKFYKLYNTTIKPLFSHYEKERKSILQRTICYSLICAILGIVLAFITFTPASPNKSSESSFVLMFLLMIAAFIAAFAIPIHMNSRFVEKLKHSCMNSILNLFGNMHWHQETEVISDADLNASGLFSAYNRREVDDGFTGIYKDVPFAISETGMTLVTGSGKRRREEQIFKGVVIKFKANKEIRNKTIVATKGDTHIQGKAGISVWIILGAILINFISSCAQTGFTVTNILTWLILSLVIIGGYYGYQAITKFSVSEVLNEVKLEDPEFSKKYKVYSSDQIESRYLVTPAFMERFKNIQTSFGTNNVKCSFYGDSLMFAISTNKNLFELGSLFCTLDDPKQLETFFNELTSIFLLVDYFKLNEESGL